MTTAVAVRPKGPSHLVPTGGLVYRPALDGLRAVAVFLVLAFHAGVARMSGGFIGVDMFFVLSGYLVTRVILSDLLGNSFGLTKFYGRRVRRLLPAALLTLVMVCAAWMLLATPVDRLALLGDAQASTLYYSNWHFAQVATDYFASNENPTPLLHFWSLSVEEQFYVFWPLILVGLWHVSRRNSKRALRVIAAAAILGGALSLVALFVTVRGGSISLAYYGTHTRAYQLLGGALLAVIIERRRVVGSAATKVARIMQIVCLAGLLLLATSRVTSGPSIRGLVAASLAVGILASLEYAPTAWGARILGVAPLTYLGKISYGTYLWHFPVLIVLQRFATMSPVLLCLVGALIVTSLASFSYQLLELPIRRSALLGRHSRIVVASGLVASLLVALLVIPSLLQSDRLPAIKLAGSGVPLSAEQRTIVPTTMAGFDVEAATKIPAGSPAAGPGATNPACLNVPIDECILVRGDGPRILLMGDSHASMLLPAMRAIARKAGATLALAAKSGCPWQQTLRFTRGEPDCENFQKQWYEHVVPEFDPDIIILASRATDHLIGSGYGVESTDGTPPTDVSALMAATAERSLLALAAPGRTLVVEEPVPVSADNAMSCLSGVALSSECSFLADGASKAELSYRALAERLPGVRTIDLDPLVCPDLPVCDPIVGGIVVRLDHDHISAAWSAFMSDDLDALLRAKGVL